MSARQARGGLAEGVDQSWAGRCAESGVLVRIFRPARSLPAQRPMSPVASPNLGAEGVPIGIEISTVASVYRGHSPSGVKKNDQHVLPCSAPLAPIGFMHGLRPASPAPVVTMGVAKRNHNA